MGPTRFHLAFLDVLFTKWFQVGGLHGEDARVGCVWSGVFGARKLCPWRKCESTSAVLNRCTLFQGVDGDGGFDPAETHVKRSGRPRAPRGGGC